MNIGIVGTGYVGLVAGVCFADSGHRVICVDNDVKKIDLLKSGQIPIYEPGLEDLLKQAKNRIDFVSDLESSFTSCEVLFIAVGTPEMSDGSADLKPTFSIIDSICKKSTTKKYIVLKSTVPVGTAKKIQAYCDQNSQVEHEIINNPEFLREGSAINDFLNPDRIVIGVHSKKAHDLMRVIYEPFLKNGSPIYFMDNASAELTKYAANAFLSVKISFINELALLADHVGADINQVRDGFTSDHRINPSFFNPGVGFGGSCFPKDVKALIHSGQEFGIPMHIIQAADLVNDHQKTILFKKIKDHFGNLKAKTFALWGLSFKPRTDDVREAPSLVLIRLLYEAGAFVRAYDPVAEQTARKACELPFENFSTAMEATQGADALIIVTEWNEFKNPDFEELKKTLKNPVIFDGRNILDPIRTTKAGFKYYCLGREVLTRLEKS